MSDLEALRRAMEKQAVVFGDGRETVCGFINIDIGSVGDSWFT